MSSEKGKAALPIDEEEPPSYSASQYAQQRGSAAESSSSAGQHRELDAQQITPVNTNGSGTTDVPSAQPLGRPANKDGFPVTTGRLRGMKYDSLRLLKAIINQEYSSLRRCLEAGVDPNYCTINPARNSGLYIYSMIEKTIFENDGAALHILLDAGADMTGQIKAQFIEEQMRLKGPGWPKTLGIYSGRQNQATSSVAPSLDPNYWATSLHTAAFLKHSTRHVATMLNHANGPSVDARDSAGRTPLHIAVLSGILATARLLLQTGADVNACTYDGVTPLHYAALFPSAGMMELLFSYDPDVTIKNNRNETALHHAARKNQQSFAEELVFRGVDIDCEGDLNMTAFFHAASDHDKPLMAFLLEWGADVDARDENGCTAFLRAVMARNIALATDLLQFGSDIDALDMDGCTALDAAMINDDANMIELLIRNGAGTQEMRESGGLVLHRAARRGSTNILRHLFSFYKVDSNFKNQLGETALHLAAAAGHAAAVRLLLRNAADVSEEDASGKTALQLAVRKVHLAVVKELIRRGATWKGNEGTDLIQATVGTYDPRQRRAIVNMIRVQCPNASIPAELEKDAHRNEKGTFVSLRSRDLSEVNRMREKQGKPSIDDELLLATLEAEGQGSASRHALFAKKDPFEECMSKQEKQPQKSQRLSKSQQDGFAHFNHMHLLPAG